MSRPALALLTASALVAGLALGLALAPRADARAPRPTARVDVTPLVLGTPVPVIPAGPMGVSEPDLAPDSASLPTVVAPSPRATPTVGRHQPEVKARAEHKAAPRPTTRPGSGRSGWATYFAAPAGTAAAGPALRRLLGKAWRGSLVDVCAASGCVQVRLTDWCACGPRKGRPTLIDLATADFASLAPLGLGVLDVTVSRA